MHFLALAIKVRIHMHFLVLAITVRIHMFCLVLSVSLCHGGGWSRKINAWYLYTLMVYL
jgi:hypothetical protein